MDINQVWPEWHEDCVLGEGSFGKVYRAKRVEYGRTFYSAIKVITVPKSQQEVKYARSQGMNDNEIYEYFRGLVDNLLNEITLMDNLKGAKNIVGIEDYKIVERQGDFGWDIFIRMELLSSFDSFISNPDFSQKDVIKLGVDICSALEICEQNSIIHRDIKPDNIFVSRFGEYKLGDFGIAKKLETTQANLSRKGTLNYMAPEVYKSENYGHSVDIYSLGLLLYTLLNNNRIAFLPSYPNPISFKDNESALARRLSGEPLTPPCNASASLSSVILKACAFNPQDRFRTATEFKNALINELNMFVQMGENPGIYANSMHFNNDMNENFLKTTNDMTANGRMVLDEYSQDTTVLSDNPYGSNTYSASQSASAEIVAVPPKHNRFCRIVAIPLSVVIFILGIVTLILRPDESTMEFSTSMSVLGIGLSILLSDKNKFATGISVTALSLPYIVYGCYDLFSYLHDSLPVESLLMLLSGLLMLIAGIVICIQREVRFGGSMGIYSVIAIIALYAYMYVSGEFSLSLWNVGYIAAAVTVFVWTLGYNSAEKAEGIKKILGIVAFVPAAIVVVCAVVSATMIVH